MRRIVSLILTLIIIFLAGCSFLGRQATTGSVQPAYQSYKEIPGVTQAEIDVVEDLLADKPRLVYGMCTSTEAFTRSDGSVGGFTELFCNRMSALFGFEFECHTYGWNELNEKIISKEIDFSGDFTVTPERLQRFIMTDAIVQRTIKIFTNMNSDSLSGIAKTRPVKCAFLNGSTTYPVIAASLNIPFEPVIIDDQSMVPSLLLNGGIDAFIEEGTLEAGYDAHDFIQAEEYYPLAYSPVSLTTSNPELKPIIDIMQKYLKNGGFYELTTLYNQGYEDYLEYKLSMHLTDEEKDYISRHNTEDTAISAACEIDNYPSSFYNAKEKEFQGVAIDVMNRVSGLTGLCFKTGNAPDASWTELLEGLEKGRYSVVSELLQTNNRENRFLWAQEPYYTDSYAMISRADYPDVDINQILFANIGLIKDSAYADVFHEWFPKSENVKTYDGNKEAFAALEKGEIDLVMATQNLFLHLTNYLEKPGFKTNIVFNYSTGSYFGLNKDEEILCSIIQKAQRYIDTEGITESWKRKVFDYEGKLLRDMLPVGLASTAVLLVALFVVFVVLIKNRKINKNLDKTVSLRTSQLERRLEQQRLMASLSQNFIATGNTDGQITEALRQIGEFLNVSRILLLRYEDQSLHYSYEWNNPARNIKSKLGMVLPVADMEMHFVDAYSKKEISRISIDDTDHERFIRRYQMDDVKNFLSLSIYAEEKFWGILEFDQCEEYSPWTPSDIDLGETAAGILSGVMTRRQMEKELERNTAELALQTSTLSTIFSSIPDIVFCKDLNSRFTRCNSRFEKHFVIKEEDIIGKDDEEALGLPADMAEAYREADKAVFDGNVITVEEYIPSAYGSELLFETIKTPLMQDGKVIGIMGISRDITRRKAAEETVKLTLDNLDAHICITEIETNKILFINEKMAKDYGGEDCIGKICWEVLRDGLTDCCEYCPLPELLKNPDQDFIWEEQSAITGRYYRNMDSLIKWHDGKLVHMRYAADITDLIKLQQDLESASKAKGEFLSRMSHEIRTPLNAVIGMNGIAMNTADPAKMQDCHEKIDNASKHLLGIINDILDMSKIEADKFELSCREFDFEKILMNITNVVNFRAEEKHQNLIVNLAGDVPDSIFSDELRLSQVITNLLSNAVKFTPENGTIELNVTKTAELGDEITLQIEVADSGIGISEEQQARLFTSFVQADGNISRRFGGTGLGLAISKRIVELMGGEIWIESEPGKGSKFIFTIKAKKGEKKARAPISPVSSKDNIHPGAKNKLELNGYTVLIAEDVKINQEIMTAVLEETGISIEFADNGQTAVSMFKSNPDKYSLILMDIQMPEMDGYTAAKEIRASSVKRAKEIPIIAMTANVFKEDIDKCLASGMNDHIGKPIDIQAVFEKIMKYTGNTGKERYSLT